MWRSVARPGLPGADEDAGDDMATGKNAFLLYHDIRKPLELLTDEERGKLLFAILDYSEFGTMPNYEGALMMAFAFIRESLDRDAEAWECKRQKRVEAGSKGGKQTAANRANATFAEQERQSAAKQAVPVPVPAPVNVFSVGGGNRAGTREDAEDEVNVYLQDRGLDPFFTFEVTEKIRRETNRFADAVFKKFTCRRPTAADYSNVFWCISLPEHDDATDTWKITLPQELKDLLMYAFEQANKAAKPGDWRYIEGVLRKQHQRGITSLDAAEDHDIERAERA